mmetsp:Transcript_52360/g.96933  ORF Transcript_52360/g.96933 Transcript_52360/m.96933 type:complete len:204 (+) Transcript_52360:1541-2152(+)
MSSSSCNILTNLILHLFHNMWHIHGPLIAVSKFAIQPSAPCPHPSSDVQTWRLDGHEVVATARHLGEPNVANLDLRRLEDSHHGCSVHVLFYVNQLLLGVSLPNTTLAISVVPKAVQFSSVGEYATCEVRACTPLGNYLLAEETHHDCWLAHICKRATRLRIKRLLMYGSVVDISMTQLAYVCRAPSEHLPLFRYSHTVPNAH